MCAMRNRFIRIMGKLYDELIKDYRVKEGLKTCINCGRDCPLPFPVLQPHQTHSASIACIDSTDVKPGSLEGIDALITDLPGMAIGVRAADCIPVLLYDTVHGAVGAVHSGWRGTVSRIAQKTVIEKDGNRDETPFRKRPGRHQGRNRSGDSVRKFPGRKSLPSPIPASTPPAGKESNAEGTSAQSNYSCRKRKRIEKVSNLKANTFYSSRP